MRKKKATKKRSKAPKLRTTKTTLEKRKKFLDAYSMTGNISYSCEQAGVERSTHYNVWMRDPKYVKAFEDAREKAGDRIEAEILRRAYGVEKPLHYQGKLTGDTVIEYSDLLLIFLAKAVRPEKFREPNAWTLNGKIGDKAISVKVLQEAMIDAESD